MKYIRSSVTAATRLLIMKQPRKIKGAKERIKPVIKLNIKVNRDELIVQI